MDEARGLSPREHLPRDRGTIKSSWRETESAAQDTKVFSIGGLGGTRSAETSEDLFPAVH